MPKINPYLTFLGNCEEAFHFYRSVFGGEFPYVGRFSDMPPAEGVTLSEEDKSKIMHMSLPMDEGTALMGSDTGGEWAPKTVIGNNVSMSVTADSKEDADRYFAQLSEGGEVTMPMEDTFWGDYFGMCTDRFGIHWMIGFNEGAQSE